MVASSWIGNTQIHFLEQQNYMLPGTIIYLDNEVIIYKH